MPLSRTSDRVVSLVSRRPGLSAWQIAVTLGKSSANISSLCVKLVTARRIYRQYDADQHHWSYYGSEEQARQA